MYALLYKCVFNKFFNDSKDSQHLMSKDSEFHKDGAIAENARSPSEDRVRGTTSWCLSDERSVRAGL